ncbi:MAG TPA: glycosyltransferase family 4 protein [Beutenbergiaceae bacterium]|nr:glycosyltransferase family 4 protein [Beutenbergiaceae bacterium]
MKIALVVDDTLDSTDGVQQVILEIGRELHRRGHEVHYLTSTTTRTDVANVHSLSKNVRFRFNGNRVGVPLPAKRRVIERVLREEQFDLVHISAPYSPLLAGKIISRLPPSTPVVGTFMILPLGKVSRWGGKLLGLLQRRQARRFNAFMAVSDPAGEFCRFMYGDPGVTTGNPVNITPFHKARERALEAAPPPKAPVSILFLGRLVERKGAGELINAVAVLRRLTSTPFEVEIAGRGPLEEEYRSRVHDLGLSQVVRFSGFIPEEDKADLLARADIIALPAYGGESFGVSVVEALAAGTGGLLAGNNPGYASTLGPLQECLIHPRDVHGFAEKLKELVESPELRRSMSEKQSLHAQEFHTPTVVDRIEQVYSQAG